MPTVASIGFATTSKLSASAVAMPARIRTDVGTPTVATVRPN